MVRTNRNGSRLGYVCAALAAFVCLVMTSTSLAANKGYKQHNLVSDVAGRAPKTDSNLVNPWGISISDQGFVWIANEGTQTSTVYKLNGAPAPNRVSRLVVTVPIKSEPGEDEQPGPTGVVNNTGSGFVVSANGKSGPASFIFASLDGTLSAWNGEVDAANAIVVADRSVHEAHYTGLAISDEGSGDFLFAANFAGAEIDMFDGSFQFMRSFTDPNMEQGYGPFNVQAVNGQLYVTYAKIGDDGEEEKGLGLGIVDVFDFNGNLVRRFAEHGQLNAPWGVALAPRNFGEFSNMILIGNFGDGHISAFDPTTGEFKGQLSTRQGEPIEIEGLWGISFGTGNKSNVLFFNAGIDDEEHGLFGAIKRQGNSQ
jgi:uncharacterized protein (TIGR03118 family)